MKRLFLVALLFACVFALFGANAESNSDFIVFGHYEQDNNMLNGGEPIEWIVLESTENQMLMISRYALDCLPFSDNDAGGKWNNSSLRSWLNEEFFFSAFTEAEQQAIVANSVSNAAYMGNSEWNPINAENTEDRVFLLSYSEANKYFSDKKELLVKGTEHARAKGAKLFGVTTIGIGETDWWLRSDGKSDKDACYVDVTGTIGSKKAKDDIGVRPVIRLDTSYDQNEFSEAQYAKALSYVENEEYASAIEIFDTLGNCNDSMSYSVFCRVVLGDEAYEAGNYSEAIKWYTDAKNCIFDHFAEEDALQMVSESEIFEKLLESKYQKAVFEKESGNLDGAIETLSALGHYRDSMDLLRDCFTEKQIQWSWLTRKTDSTVNAGKDTGYSKTDIIKDGDPHFGWYLGRFMMSGYTERLDENDVPVFIKTPGDQLVLWFNLEQDIDALNQDPNLVIQQDKNGSDQQFQIPKSDFGRGALFIRHIDARNSDTTPQEYKDYLAAHDDTGANTRVEIKEEGIYEVALDYEIAKKTKIAVVEKADYYDYRISFTFEVRNGSGMFYLFDLSSGSELQDYSVAPDGFRIDLANSKSLSINYTRYALNQSGTGLDVRKSTVASDGEQLDSVGYYEVTATNKETGEKLTKHLFVGSEEDLLMYKEADASLLERF